jgi:hypothetical protein
MWARIVSRLLRPPTGQPEYRTLRHPGAGPSLRRTLDAPGPTARS